MSVDGSIYTKPTRKKLRFVLASDWQSRLGIWTTVCSNSDVSGSNCPSMNFFTSPNVMRNRPYKTGVLPLDVTAK